MRNGEKLGREVDRLRGLLDELRAGEAKAADDRELYRALIDLLPISLTVQDEDGRFILVNAVAASHLAMPAQALIGSSPADFLPPEEAAQRREWEIGLMQSGDAAHHRGPVSPARRGERTWLTTHKPVHILDRDARCSRARSTSPSASRSRTSWRSAPISTISPACPTAS